MFGFRFNFIRNDSKCRQKAKLWMKVKSLFHCLACNFGHLISWLGTNNEIDPFQGDSNRIFDKYSDKEKKIDTHIILLLPIYRSSHACMALIFDFYKYILYMYISVHVGVHACRCTYIRRCTDVPRRSIVKICPWNFQWVNKNYVVTKSSRRM